MDTILGNIGEPLRVHDNNEEIVGDSVEDLWEKLEELNTITDQDICRMSWTVSEEVLMFLLILLRIGVGKLRKDLENVEGILESWWAKFGEGGLIIEQDIVE